MNQPSSNTKGIPSIIDNITYITDLRESTEFVGSTFSKYKLADVKKQLLNDITNHNIEQACYWVAELICSNHYIELWEIILLFYSKYIHIGNPRLAIYLHRKLQEFKQYMNTEHHVTCLRNIKAIRELFCKIILVLIYSKQQHVLIPTNIPNSDFEISNITNRFIAPSKSYATEIMHDSDPSDVFIGINELVYNLLYNSYNEMQACYWVEWLIQLDASYKKNKNPIKMGKRTNIFDDIPVKYSENVIWIIWDIMLIQSNKNNNRLVHEIINGLFKLFLVKYTIACNKRRRFLIYNAISMLSPNINVDIHIIEPHNETIMNTITQNIDKIYIQIKKGECSNEEVERIIANKKKNLIPSANTNTNTNTNTKKTSSKKKLDERSLDKLNKVFG